MAASGGKPKQRSMTDYKSEQHETQNKFATLKPSSFVANLFKPAIKIAEENRNVKFSETITVFNNEIKSLGNATPGAFIASEKGYEDFSNWIDAILNYIKLREESDFIKSIRGNLENIQKVMSEEINQMRPYTKEPALLTLIADALSGVEKTKAQYPNDSKGSATLLQIKILCETLQELVSKRMEAEANADLASSYKAKK